MLMHLEEAGITSKWKHNIQKIEQEYYKPLISNTSNGLKAYSMNDLWFAFVLLFVGYAISFVLLMIEFFIKKYKNIITLILKNVQHKLYIYQRK